MSVPAMSEVAQALLNLSSLVPEVLHLKKHNGSKGLGKRLVGMQPSADTKRLYVNAKLWMEDVIRNATADVIPTYEAVKVLIRVLHSLDPLAFNHVAADVPLSSDSKINLDAEFQQAMMYKADLNKTQIRVLKSYLCAANVDVLQPESIMNKLEVNDFVKPTSVDFKDGGNHSKVAWCMPVDDLLRFNKNKASKANAIDYANLDKAHVILVGDHGQGAFRMMATLLLITKPIRRRGNWRRQRGDDTHPVENECIGTKLADGHCGYVQCQKDAYQVLSETIMEPIDKSLADIKAKGRVTVCRNCQRASCATYGQDPCTLLHERLSMDLARSRRLQRH